MKKRLKKLALNRETLRHLQTVHLGRVGGGGDTHEVLTGCACTDTCGTDAGRVERLLRWVRCGEAAAAPTPAPPATPRIEVPSGCATNC